MDNFSIKIKNVSKCYQIYDSPRDRLRQFLNFSKNNFYKEFWALKNISIEIEKGQTFGIIGNNGAGKSTLLQILCGTLTPTDGTVDINGRIAALLELGAGFGPEFSGRENIYLNARVLGLSNKEIDLKFADIVKFADIDEFIDMPVKTYSSGMFVRLAFSIAIHVEPSILIIDEALSVGDIAFQNKCILKIRELKNKGTTLLFVTHDLSTLQLICDQVAWLHRGEVVMIGDPIAVSQEYQASITGIKLDKNIHQTVISQKNTGMAKFIETAYENGRENPTFNVGDTIKYKFSVIAQVPLEKTVFTVSIFRKDGDWILGQTSLEAGIFWDAKKAGEVHHGKFILQPNCLAPGDYLVAFGANSEDLSVCYALADLALPFSVRWNYPTWGKFIHPCQWIAVN